MLTLGKQRRNWLFKRSRPTVRSFVAADRGFLWAAHLSGIFGLPEDLTQEEFLAEVVKLFGHYSLIWIVEDDSTQFRAGRGPIALVGIKTDGWVYDPNPVFFPWARKRHILRSCVAFLQMIRYQKDVGCCTVHATKDQTGVLSHMAKYGVLRFVGRVPNGSPKGDTFLYSINGKKSSVVPVVDRIAA